MPLMLAPGKPAGGNCESSRTARATLRIEKLCQKKNSQRIFGTPQTTLRNYSGNISNGKRDARPAGYVKRWYIVYRALGLNPIQEGVTGA